MGLVDDPISGTLGTLLTHGLEKTVLQRATLCLEAFLGASTSFLIGAGAVLASLAPSILLKAVGVGMVCAGVAEFTTIQTSQNAKGLTVSFSQKVADAKLDNPTTTIERNK